MNTLRSRRCSQWVPLVKYYQTTPRHFREGSILLSHRLESLKCDKYLNCRSLICACHLQCTALSRLLRSAAERQEATTVWLPLYVYQLMNCILVARKQSEEILKCSFHYRWILCMCSRVRRTVRFFFLILNLLCLGASFFAVIVNVTWCGSCFVSSFVCFFFFYQQEARCKFVYVSFCK